MAQEEKKLNEDKLKSPLAHEKNNDPIKQLNDKIDNLTSLLYLRQIEDHFNLITNELMESNRQRDQRIELLTEKINNQNELLQDIKDLLLKNLDHSVIQTEKQAFEELSKKIMDESEDDIKIEPLPEKEKVEEKSQTTISESKKEDTHEILNETPIQEESNKLNESMDINEGVKVIERGQVDDLILSNAVTYIKNKGDKLVINGVNEEEEEVEKKSELEEAEERIEEQQNVDLSRGDITEVFEEETLNEETPKIEGAQDIVPEVAQQVVAQESVEQPNQKTEVVPQDVKNTAKYTYENIKAVKTFVQRVKTINPKLASNTEADLATMPQNMKQSWDDNIIIMPEVLGPQRSR